MSIRIVINPDFYTVDDEGQVNGWSAISPFKKSFPDYHRFALTIGKSADIVIKLSSGIGNDTEDSRAILVNHIGAEISDPMFHTLVNNVHQYDYVTMILDYMSRSPEAFIKVYHNGSELTPKQVAEFKLS